MCYSTAYQPNVRSCCPWILCISNNNNMSPAIALTSFKLNAPPVHSHFVDWSLHVAGQGRLGRTGMGSSACQSLFLLQCHLKTLQPFCSALEPRTDVEWLPCFFCPAHTPSLCRVHHTTAALVGHPKAPQGFPSEQPNNEIYASKILQPAGRACWSSGQGHCSVSKRGDGGCGCMSVIIYNTY